MVFSSLTFLTIFFPIFLALYFLRGNIRWRNGVLLIASLVFYAWGEPIWILGMIGSTFINWISAQMIVLAQDDRQKRFWLAAGIVISGALLFVCKYAAFFFNSFSALFASSVRIPGIDLPIGISFYTFQIISYTVDVYREETPAQKSFARLLLYVSCFPQLIAGPIVRYSDVAKQIGKRRTTPGGFSSGMRRFVIGLGKKIIFANLCGKAVAAMPLAGTGLELSALGAWYAALMYALQVYFDFSGYSDMAIGIGKILGFTYRENFNHPFMALGVGDFWRRWHISLSEWFREYIMYPLMRAKIFRKLSMKKSRRFGRMFYRNLTAIICTTVVWAFTGLWHGASWNYVVWGLYFGLFQMLEKFAFEKIHQKLPNVVKWLLNMAITLIGFIIFYYTDITLVFKHVGAMFFLTGNSLIDANSLLVMKTYSVFPILAFVLSLPIGEWLGAFMKKKLTSSACEIAYAGGMLVLYVFCILFLVGQSFNPFIYFQF